VLLADGTAMLGFSHSIFRKMNTIVSFILMNINVSCLLENAIYSLGRLCYLFAYKCAQ